MKRLIPNALISGLAALTIAATASWLGSPAARAADDPIAAQRVTVVKYTNPDIPWTGPTKSPIAQPGKNIVLLAYDMKNPGVSNLAQAFITAAKTIGWNISIADGQGNTTGQQNAINQALALKPDGMVSIAFPDLFVPYFKRAHDQGIPIIGMTGAPDAGPFPDRGLDFNVMQSVKELGTALADWIIVNANGKARVILISDKSFDVIEAKMGAIRDELKTCAGCEVVLDAQVPIGDGNTRMPQLVPAWINQYGTAGPPLYIVGSDFYLTFAIPALRTAGPSPDQIVLAGLDGDPPVYERIRAGDSYQRVTVPFAFGMQGYEAVDQMNRLLNKEPPANYTSTVYLIDKTTVDTAGGRDNIFVPSNDYAKKFQELWTKGNLSP
jgi:ribose transport system substrate-binding protein